MHGCSTMRSTYAAMQCCKRMAAALLDQGVAAGYMRDACAAAALARPTFQLPVVQPGCCSTGLHTIVHRISQQLQGAVDDPMQMDECKFYY